MANNAPSKVELETVFNRLRSIATNKSCFDCGSKNPTWASVTYGVFICIDCSAVHRGLGVHLTFVRSTNLDTNWTWLQVRQMQLGGNANAAQFFRQHNCNTSDAQQKYNSRAATLYREKLAASAQHAMKLHGTKLHLDATHESHHSAENDQKEEDFFADCTNNDNNDFSYNNNDTDTKRKFDDDDDNDDIKISHELAPKTEMLLSGEPSVDFLNSSVPVEPPKSTIGVRKIQPKKSGMGGKKGGLGATKVKTNFADIEQKATLADQMKEPVPEKKMSEEEEASLVASVRLAYQDLSIKKTREEEKLKISDPTKAKQMERLGMGFNIRGAVSHSAVTDMKTISQENAPKTSTKNSFEREREINNDFFDDYTTSMYSSNSNSKQDRDLLMMGFEIIEPIESRQPTIQTMFSAAPSKTSASISDQPSYSRSSARNASTPAKNYDNDEAQKKFGSAKAISSDQFFGNEASSFEKSNNLSRFQGSSSISSADYFGESTSEGSSSNKSQRYSSYNGPDLDEVKESVRQGVTKVAGKLSSLANDVMSSIHDKYGY